MGHNVRMGEHDSSENEYLRSSVQADFVSALCHHNTRAVYSEMDRKEAEENAEAARTGQVGYFSYQPHNRDWNPAEAVRRTAQDLPSSTEEFFSRYGRKVIDRDFTEEDYQKACEFIKKAASLDLGIYSF